MQTISSTIDSAAYACESIRSGDVIPTGIGSAIYGSLSLPLGYARSRADTHDQLADEHNWMSTKLPANSPQKKLNRESSNAGELAPSHTEELDLDSSYSRTLELDFGEAKAAVKPETASTEDRRIRGLAKAMGRRLKLAGVRRSKNRATRRDVTHPRDAPEGSNLDDLAIVTERMNELPHTTTNETCIRLPKKGTTIRDAKSLSSQNQGKVVEEGRKEMEDEPQKTSKRNIEAEVMDALQPAFKPTLRRRAYSDSDGAVPQDSTTDYFEPQKLYAGLTFENEPKKTTEEKEGSAGEKKELAEPLSDKKKGKLPTGSSSFGGQYDPDKIGETATNDADLGDDEVEDGYFAEEWMCDESDKLKPKGYTNF